MHNANCEIIRQIVYIVMICVPSVSLLLGGDLLSVCVKKVVSVRCDIFFVSILSMGLEA
jgi:hypothetical protein